MTNTMHFNIILTQIFSKKGTAKTAGIDMIVYEDKIKLKGYNLFHRKKQNQNTKNQSKTF